MSQQQVGRTAAKKSAPEAGDAPKGGKDKSALKGMSFADGEKALAPEGARPKADGGKKKGALSLGDEGPEVTALQVKLARMSKEAEVDPDFKALFNPGKVDGKFGAKLEGAIRALQSNNQLPLTGVYDAATAAALDQELSFLDQMGAATG